MSSSPDYDEHSDSSSEGSDGSAGTDYSYDFDGYDDDFNLKDDSPLPVANNKTSDSRTDFIDSTTDHATGAQEHRCNEAGASLVSLSRAFLSGFLALPLELKDRVLDYTLSFGNAEQAILVTEPPLIESAEHRDRWRWDDCPGLNVSRPDQVFLNVSFEPAEREHWTCRWAGHVIFKESIKAWYRRNTFILSGLSILADFAITDCWGMEVVPKHHLRKVEFSIHEDDLAHLEDPGGYARPSDRLRELRAELDLLRNLCEKTQITMHVSSQTFAGESVPVWNAEQHGRAEELIRKMDYGIFRQLRSLRASKYMVTVVIDGGCIIKPDTEVKPGVWFSLLLDM